MPCLYTYSVPHSGTWPVFRPMSYIRSEAFEAFGRNVRQGYYCELWDDGRCIQRMGPHSVLPRPPR
jgi:hypothetical protein